MKKPVAFYKIDDLFKHGDLLYDKLNDQIFIYDQLKHKDNIRKSPNNYRKGHRGDIKGKPSNTGEIIYNKYIKNRLVKKEEPEDTEFIKIYILKKTQVEKIQILEDAYDEGFHVFWAIAEVLLNAPCGAGGGLPTDVIDNVYQRKLKQNK